MKNKNYKVVIGVVVFILVIVAAVAATNPETFQGNFSKFKFGGPNSGPSIYMPDMGGDIGDPDEIKSIRGFDKNDRLGSPGTQILREGR